MIKIFTNVITRKSYNENGDLFPDGLPRIFFNGTDEVRWQLCTATPDIADESSDTPETLWTKDTEYSQYAAIGAFLTADTDFVKRMRGTLTADVSSGSVASVSANIPGATLATIPETGTITLFATTGEMETIEYTERAIANENVQFTIATGTTLEHSYANGGTMDCVQSVLMQSSLDTQNSDVSSGLFVFQITAYSRKLHDALAYANTKQLDVAGLELAIFNVDTENSAVVDLERFDIDTFSIRSGIADTSMDAQVTPQRESEAVTIMSTLLASGFEIQFSADGETNWHSTQSIEDPFDLYFRIRNHGAGGTWSSAIKMPSGSNWGGISGNIEDQADLMQALENAGTKPIIRDSAPTTSTEGKLGQPCIATTTGKTYTCVSIGGTQEAPEYNWAEVITSNGGTIIDTDLNFAYTGSSFSTQISAYHLYVGQSITVGDNVSGSIVVGSTCKLGKNHQFSVVFGVGLDTAEARQAIFGQYNVAKAGVKRIVGAGTSNSNRRNIEELDNSGNLYIAGGYEQGITVIPAATTAYTLSEGQQSHAPEAASVYTLPAVTDATRTHACILDVQFSTNVLTYEFQDSSGTTLVPLPMSGYIVNGTIVRFLCTYSAQASKWVIMPVVLNPEVA